MQLRNATPIDLPRILALNQESVHFLSPLDADRLALLHAQSTCRRVVESEGRVIAFLLALREGTDYQSSNYRWFADRFERFLYIDRVVVGVDSQGRGIGKLLYADVLEFAQASDARQLTCEFDIDPPNETSRRFHAGFGFVEIGRRRYGADGKQVAMQALAVALRLPG